mmetsp:Transcript_27765/g.60490  ORF Transcript_27765/g.60490 Transcript_27765/m.60490 type:complete len:235 (-) Transcript_27765:628-1332(-)
MTWTITHICDPHANRLGEETAVAEGHDGNTSRLQHPMHFLKHLLWLHQVVHAHHVGHKVKLAVAIGQLGILVQICHCVLCCLLVGSELLLDHPGDGHTLGLEILGVVADPGAANVQHAVLSLRCLGKLQRIEVADRVDGVLVNVGDKARRIVETLIIALILTPEVCSRVRPLFRPLGFFQRFTHRAVGDRKWHLQRLTVPANEIHALHHLAKTHQLDVKAQVLARQGMVHVQHR